MHLHLMPLFLTLAMIRRKHTGEDQGHPTCLTSFLGLGRFRYRSEAAVAYHGKHYVWKTLFLRGSSWMQELIQLGLLA